ncbi:MAG: O-antigen ligase family protein [Elusimicrobiales bacterium]|nr:O-antigen ligase family protein [Elusimicrobiales bacterium]
MKMPVIFKVQWPKFLLAALAVAEFFWYPRFAFWGAHVRVVDFIAFASFFCYLFSVPESFPPKSSSDDGKRQFSLILLVVFLSGLLSVGFSQHAESSINKIIQLFENCWLAYFAMLYATRDNIKLFVDSLLLVALFSAAFSLFFQYLPNDGDIYMGQIVRLSGLSAGYFATNMLVALLFAVSLFLNRERLDRGGLVIAAVLLVFIVLTQIRTVWILLVALLGASVFYDFTAQKIKRLLILLSVPFIMFISTVGLVGKLAPGFSRGQWLTTLNQRGVETAHVRVELWKAAMKIFADYPFFGTGTGTFGVVYQDPAYSTPLLSNLAEVGLLSKGIDAHSVFFTRMAETGLVGIMSYFLMFIFLGTCAKKIMAFARDPVVLAFIVFVPVAFLSDLISDQLGLKLFWVLSGFLAGITGVREEYG